MATTKVSANLLIPDVATKAGAETLTNKTINGANNTISNIGLTSQVTGVLPIANGGSHNGSLGVTAGGVVYTDGSKLMNAGAGILGQVLKSNGASAPSWSSGTSPLVIQSRSTAYTALATDDVINCSSSGGPFTVTLYAASGNSGKVLTLTKTDSSVNAVTIDGNASETINGALTTLLSTQWESVTLYCDGSNWFVRERRTPSVTTAYTLTIGAVTTPPTQGAGATKRANWRRDGKYMEVNFNYAQTAAGTAGSGTYLFPLPAGYTIDTSEVDLSTSGNGAGGSKVGNGYCATTTLSSTNFAGLFNVVAYNTTNFQVAYDVGTAGQLQAVSGAAFGLNNTTMYYSFTARVPISGWEG